MQSWSVARLRSRQDVCIWGMMLPPSLGLDPSSSATIQRLPGSAPRRPEPLWTATMLMLESVSVTQNQRRVWALGVGREALLPRHRLPYAPLPLHQPRHPHFRGHGPHQLRPPMSGLFSIRRIQKLGGFFISP